MPGKFICGAVAVAMLALASRGARACGQGSSYGGALYVGAIVVGLTDVGMSIADLTTVSGVSKPSAAYGTVELIVALPQLALGIAGLTAGGQSSSFFAGYTLWMAALTAHGIWSIAAAHAAQAPNDAPDPEPPPDRPGDARMGLGPTYVPLGPLAQVGFGLSGRF